MESSYQDFDVFQKKLYKYEDSKDLYYKLLNILFLICFSNGFFYCFCNRYQGCELDCNLGWKLCPLCQILIDYHGFEEELDQNQYNLSNLKHFAFRLFPFLIDCYKINQYSLQAFSGHYHYYYLSVIVTRDKEVRFL